MTENKSAEELAREVLIQITSEGELLDLRHELGEEITLSNILELAKERIEPLPDDVKELVSQALREELNVTTHDTTVTNVIVSTFNEYAVSDVPPWEALGITEKGYRTIQAFIQITAEQLVASGVDKELTSAEIFEMGAAYGLIVGHISAQVRAKMGVDNG